MTITIDGAFVRKLAKNLRVRTGAEVKHTEILDDVAAALGWRTDALMHSLKNEQKPAPAKVKVSVPNEWQWTVIQVFMKAAAGDYTTWNITTVRDHPVLKEAVQLLDDCTVEDDASSAMTALADRLQQEVQASRSNPDWGEKALASGWIRTAAADMWRVPELGRSRF